MYCNRCRKEYEEGITDCPDCGIQLTNASDREYVAMKPVKVITTVNQVETGLIMELLQGNGIACFKKDYGPGGFMNVKYGFSVFGEEIYVDEQDFGKASSIIRELSPDSEQYSENDCIDEENSIEKVSEEDDSYQNYPFYRNPRILARAFIISQIVIVIIIYFLTKYLS